MQQLLEWTLETIRQEPSDFSWMEEYRYEWTPLISNTLKQIVEGKAVLIVTDEQRNWFSHYIINNINAMEEQRPLLPFYRLKNLFPKFDELHTPQEFELLEDLLDISYPNGYLMWYIGAAETSHTQFCYRYDNSFLWIYDEDVPNSFTLKGVDRMRDIKLIQLFNLFDKTLSEAIFGDLDLG
jgi:hypothetical protein